MSLQQKRVASRLRDLARFDKITSYGLVSNEALGDQLQNVVFRSDMHVTSFEMIYPQERDKQRRRDGLSQLLASLCLRGRPSEPTIFY